MALVDEGLELLTEDECRDLLRSASVGRVGVSVKALPVILPVNYQLIADKVVFWSAPGLKLDAAHRRTVVAFEVDGFDEGGHRGWSVLAVGIAAEIEDPDVLDAVSRDGPRPWLSGNRDHLIQISVEFLSGRRIVTES